MQSIKLQARVGEDGILKLEVPVGVYDADLEVIVVVQPLPASDDKGWPEGFFERTYGSFSDEPLTRPPQGDYEEREELL